MLVEKEYSFSHAKQEKGEAVPDYFMRLKILARDEDVDTNSEFFER
jgi:hypothetical protein